MEAFVTGIQQIGIGVSDVDEAWQAYRRLFGMDVEVFKDSGKAALMTRYTGGQAHGRTAVLAGSMQGGGAFEIWQYTSRSPSGPAFDIKIGDYGIFAAIMKSRDIERSFEHHRKEDLTQSPKLTTDPAGCRHYYLRDPFGIFFEVVETSEVFSKTDHPCGGVIGALICVSDVESAMKVYKEVLGYDQIVFDVTDSFEDLSHLPGGKEKLRRIRLAKNGKPRGSFSRFYGSSMIDLVSNNNGPRRKIYEDRYWGDLGYIHICFETHGTDSLKARCEQNGTPFTVDSEDGFDMGETAGRFSYFEDPDGTLIELVETYRIPILKKIGWYLDLQKRDPEKPLPGWMLKTLRLSRVRD